MISLIDIVGMTLFCLSLLSFFQRGRGIVYKQNIKTSKEHAPGVPGSFSAGADSFHSVGQPWSYAVSEGKGTA